MTFEMSEPWHLYRYTDRLCGSEECAYVSVDLEEYRIIKRTLKGVWISRYPSCFSDAHRFVRLIAHKKFACETKEEAMESFKARKKRQIRILKSQLEKAELALAIANKFDVNKAKDTRRMIYGIGAIDG